MNNQKLIKNEFGGLISVSSRNYHDDDVCIAVGNSSSFNSQILNDLLCFMEERFESVGFITNILVEHEHRGQGYGASLLKEYLNTTGKRTEVDFLFAKYRNPQKPGFVLLDFYQKHGFEKVMVNNGEVLMVNKGLAQEFKNALSPDRDEDLELDEYAHIHF